MPRKKSTVQPPEWYSLANYKAAGEMDIPDWYLNLKLRRAAASAHTSRMFWVRQAQSRSLLRRIEGLPFEFIFSHDDLGPDFVEIYEGRVPVSGVRQLRTDELYLFEGMLPETIRQFGRDFKPGATRRENAPDGFAAPLDDAFERRLASSFVRIDWTLPDKTLLQDMERLIGKMRQKFKEIGGPQPYRDALDIVEVKRGEPKTRVWANRKLLPIMDLLQWRKDSGSQVADAEICRLAGAEENDYRQAVKEAENLLQPLVLEAWLLPLAREAIQAAA